VSLVLSLSKESASKKGSEFFRFGAEDGSIRAFFVLDFVFWSFEFVSDFELRISDLPRYSSTPKVKKCKKSVQNMLKTCCFLLIFVQNARVFVDFLSIFAHFYPNF
jgi:hypothetical protein